MGSQILGPHQLDARRVYEVDLAPELGGDLTGQFTGSETLATSIYPGGRAAAVASPATAWLGDATGAVPRLAITVTPADIASLTPGVYRVETKADPGTDDVVLFDGRIRITGAPGSEAAPVSYVTDEDLVDLCPVLDEWMAETDWAGFARQRARATDWLNEIILGRWKVENYAPEIGQAGYGSWMMYGGSFDQPPSVWLRQQLAAQLLVVRPTTVEIVASRAIFLIGRWQVTKDGASPLRRLAREFGAVANELVKCYRAEIDLNGDGYAEVVVNCGASSVR